MRSARLGSVLVVALLPGLVAAQDNLQGQTLDLLFPTLDLVLKVETLAGATQSLEVKESATEVRIEIAADVLFEFDKADIRPQAADALKQLATLIRERKARTARIEGHTDAKGADAYNQRLSERRAKAVKDWLEAKENVSGVQFVIKGLGSAKPIAPNTKPDGTDDPEGRQKNRRVEIVLSKR